MKDINNYNIRTSYFRLVGNKMTNSLSLVHDIPAWYIYKVAEDIAPEKDLYDLLCTKKISRRNFIKEYTIYLSNKNPYEILNKYNNKVLLGKSKIENDLLLFCPRLVFVSWIYNTTGYQITELTKDDIKNINNI